MNKKLTSLLVASLFGANGAGAADDPFVWSGSVGVGMFFSDTEGGTRNGAFGNPPATTPVTPFTGPHDKAKAYEYRDLQNGPIGNIDLRGENSRNYVRFFGENFGRDDQFMNLRGGQYSNYKYQLYEERMPHNFSWNALTPFGGIGTTLLTAPPGAYPQAQNPATWNMFDYQLQRDNYGGNIEFNFNSPWYIRTDFNENTMKGLRPQSARLGTSSGNGMIEFGAPTDYKTTNYSADAGYSVKQYSFNVNLLYSKFSDSNDYMQFANFYMQNGLDTYYLPPNNELKRIGINGTLRQLPVESTLAVRATYSKLTNNFDVTSNGLLPTNNAAPPPAVGYLNTQASSGTFDGDIVTKTASLSLTSNWARNVDSRIYYNYYEQENNSTLVTYSQGFLGTPPCPAVSFPLSSTPTQFCVGPYPNGLFGYKKQDLGVDAGWRVERGNKVSGGLNYLEIKREHREDAEKTDVTTFWAEYKNTMLENASGRIKYSFINRRSDLNPARPPNTNPFSTTGILPTQVPYYFRAYDVSNSDVNSVKLVLDWSPVRLLDTGVEAAYRKTDYKELSYGRTDDTRQEYNLTVAYGDPKKFRITALANYENIEFNQAYRAGTPASGPITTPTTANFDWSTLNTQTNKMFALIADWPTTERLEIKASYTWIRTDGGVDFGSTSPLSPTGSGNFSPFPLVNYQTDNTKKQVINLKGDYKIDKRWTGTVGYVWEKYDYSDDQMRGYQGYYPYYQYLGGTNNSWFSGAFANPSYRTNIVYFMGTYKFN